jgi:hypothetical protein
MCDTGCMATTVKVAGWPGSSEGARRGRCACHRGLRGFAGAIFWEIATNVNGNAMKYIRDLNTEQIKALRRCTPWQFVLPTELVAYASNWHKPQLPVVGRCWPLHCSDAALFGANSAPRVDGTCTSHCYQAVVEYYRDNGDDGHVSYLLAGYLVCEDKDVDILTQYDHCGCGVWVDGHDSDAIHVRSMS